MSKRKCPKRREREVEEGEIERRRDEERNVERAKELYLYQKTIISLHSALVVACHRSGSKGKNPSLELLQRVDRWHSQRPKIPANKTRDGVNSKSRATLFSSRAR